MVCESCSKQHAAKLRDATQCAREAHAIFPRVMRRNHTTPFTTLLAREAAQLHLSRAARSALPNTRCHVQGDALKFRYLLSLPLSFTPRPLSYLNWRWGSAAPCRDGSKLRSGSQLPEHPSLGHRGFKPQGHLGGESGRQTPSQETEVLPKMVLPARGCRRQTSAGSRRQDRQRKMRRAGWCRTRHSLADPLDTGGGATRRTSRN